jgi:hypothetical protein
VGNASVLLGTGEGEGGSSLRRLEGEGETRLEAKARERGRKRVGRRPARPILLVDIIGIIGYHEDGNMGKTS